MNNTRQKNVIMGIDDMNVIPYQTGDLRINDGNVNSIRLNNVLQQLVANDLFIENSLKQREGTIGPKTLGDSEIDSQSNGTKWYGISDERFRINHKIDHGTIGTENIVHTNITDRTNFLKKFGEYIIGGTDIGIFWSTDGMTFTLVQNFRGVDAWVGDSNMFVASDEDVYECTLTPDEDVPMQFTRINAFALPNINSLYYDPEGRTLYVGTVDGNVYSAAYVSSDTQIDFNRTFSFDGNSYGNPDVRETDVGKVNDVICLEQYDSDGNRIKSITSDNSTIVATDMGLYRSERHTCLDGFRKTIVNRDIIGSVSIGTNTFCVSESSVYRLLDDGQVTVIAYGLESLVGIKYCLDGNAYVFGVGYVSKIESNGEKLETVLQDPQIGEIRDVEVMQGTLVISTQYGLKAVFRQKTVNGPMEGRSIRQIYVPKGYRESYVYVRTSEGKIFLIADVIVSEGGFTGTEIGIETPQDATLLRMIPNDMDNLDLYVKMQDMDGFTVIYKHSHVQSGTKGLYEGFDVVGFDLKGETRTRFRSVNFMNDRGVRGQGLFTFDGDFGIYVSSNRVLQKFPSSSIEKDDIHAMKFFCGNGKRNSVCISNVIYSYTGSEDGILYRRVSTDTSRYNRITRIGINRFLVGTENGLFSTRYVQGDLIPPYLVDTGAELRDVHRAVVTGDMQNVPKYLLLTDEKIRKSDDYRKWEDFITVGRCSTEDFTTAKDVVVQDMYHYCIGGGCGIENTKYSYDVIDDFDHFDDADFENLFRSMSSVIEERTDNFVFGDHVREHHNGESLITALNRKMRTDFSNLSSDGTWPTSETRDNYGTVGNDFVKTVDFGRYGDGRFRINIENYLLSTESTDFSYIVKTWYSGLREIYINIPTTHTYYLPHNQGCPDCSMYKEKMLRKNLMQFGTDVATTDGDVNSHCTRFTVHMDNVEFTIDGTPQVQSNGNSLPLRIYKDQDSVDRDGPQANMFHSFILPTVMVKCKVNNYDENDSESESSEHEFRFACFGTDSQSLRMQFHDPKAFDVKEIFTIVFNSNGADGQMDTQTVPYGMEKQKRLRANMFTMKSGSGKFLGWSCYPSPKDSSDVQFADTSYIGLAYLPQDIRSTLKVGGRVNLYATWGNFDLDSDASTFTLKSTNEEFYIDSVDIDPNTKYGNNVVISYGD